MVAESCAGMKNAEQTEHRATRSGVGLKRIVDWLAGALILVVLAVGYHYVQKLVHTLWIGLSIVLGLLVWLFFTLEAGVTAGFILYIGGLLVWRFLGVAEAVADLIKDLDKWNKQRAKGSRSP